MVTFEDLLANDTLQEWLEGHRLGIAASLRLDGHWELPIEGAVEFIAQYLTPIPDDGWDDNRLLRLPLHTLERLLHLAKLPPSDDVPLPPAITGKAACLARVIDRLTVLDPDKPEAVCPIRFVEQTQSLVFHSNWGADQLGRLFVSQADRVFSISAASWKDRDSDYLSEFRILRSTWMSGPSTLDRLRAAILLGEKLMWKQQHNWWVKRFKFGLLDRLVAWPLLVMRHDGDERGNDAALSLPLGVDIEMREAGGVMGIRDILGAPPAVSPDRWRASYLRILRGAVGTFRHARGIGGASSIDRVAAVFDFRFADELIRPLLSKISLADRSMEAYLISVILSRLLGQAVSPSTLITGEVSEGAVVNAELVWPGGVPRKLDYVFSSAVADRVIVPASNDNTVGDFLNGARSRQTASVIHIRELRQVLQAAIGLTASPHRFVRCPELSSAEELPPPCGLLVQTQTESVERALAENAGIYVDIADHVSALDLTASEVHLALRQRESATGNPLTWLFVRIHEDEDDDALWELIGEGIGASEAEIDGLIRAGSPVRLAERLVAMLELRGPRAAPQYVVVVGGSERWRMLEQIPAIAASIHGLKPVLQELDRLAKNSVGSAVVCRFILAPMRLRDPFESEGPASIPEPDWLDRLRVFRFGFDQACAAFLLQDLEWRGLTLRKHLDSAVNCGWLRKLPDGDYIVASGRGAPINIREPRTLARHHHAATRALASFLAYNVRRVGLSRDEASMVANVLEASYHLGAAIHYDGKWSNASNEDHKETQPREEQYLFMHKFSRRRSLSTLRCSALLSDAPFVVMRWVEEESRCLKSEGIALNPLICAWDQNYVLAALNHNIDGTRAFVQGILKRIFQLFEHALKNCDASQFSESHDCLLSTVVSRLDGLVALLRKDKVLVKMWKSLVGDAGPLIEFKNEVKTSVQSWCNTLCLSDLNQQVKKILLADTDLQLATAPLGEWCERIARDEEDPVTAVEILARSVLGNPRWITAWPWFFGALQQANAQTEHSNQHKQIRLRVLEKAALLQLERDNVLRQRVAGQRGHTDPSVATNLNPFAELRRNNPAERRNLGLDYLANNLSSKKVRARLVVLNGFDLPDIAMPAFAQL
ncbi:MAG: hypothetical protein JWQ90_3412 [Hydrocarboniphaga sp.]|uniref:hypothetical protein n=1 Tax=Hydrocarboniphaga sp. TaxID=2033016 RepID=UPI00260F346D|nr:hypothetical protein [Hydrocarboniphaga sp.]MDB5970962.1 hypothetical protein [Hydrocarboniphaga sp.]